jgi:hypothetical protein
MVKVTAYLSSSDRSTWSNYGMIISRRKPTKLGEEPAPVAIFPP